MKYGKKSIFGMTNWLLFFLILNLYGMVTLTWYGEIHKQSYPAKHVEIKLLEAEYLGINGKQMVNSGISKKDECADKEDKKS